MNLRCVNCGGAQIEVGEAGAPSHCAQCGGRMATLTVQPVIVNGPKVRRRSAREFFDEMHRAVDRAWASNQ